MSQKKKQVRKAFRDAVFNRDKYTCKGCGERMGEEDLDAHHITNRNDMPNGGYVKENGITLCKNGCHEKAEAEEEGFEPEVLYRKIGSSHDIAERRSRQLR
tara:strand:+ start:6998 stop:7300 length:303 start_codon:yes stop_codon:yes gene_type:complete